MPKLPSPSPSPLSADLSSSASTSVAAATLPSPSPLSTDERSNARWSPSSLALTSALSLSSLRRPLVDRTLVLIFPSFGVCFGPNSLLLFSLFLRLYCPHLPRHWRRLRPLHEAPAPAAAGSRLVVVPISTVRLDGETIFMHVTFRSHLPRRWLRLSPSFFAFPPPPSSPSSPASASGRWGRRRWRKSRERRREPGPKPTLGKMGTIVRSTRRRQREERGEIDAGEDGESCSRLQWREESERGELQPQSKLMSTPMPKKRDRWREERKRAISAFFLFFDDSGGPFGRPATAWACLQYYVNVVGFPAICRN